MIQIIKFDEIDFSFKKEIKKDKFLTWAQWDYYYYPECDKSLIVFKDGEKIKINVPKSYTSNAANIPFFLQGIFEPTDSRWGFASFYHDFLYSKQAKEYDISRFEADILFYQIMKKSGANFFVRAFFFAFVSIFGCFFYESK